MLSGRQISLNPNIRILCKKGNFFAVPQAMSGQPVNINPFALVVLYTVMSARESTDIVAEVAQSCAANKVPCNPQQINPVIQELRRLNILVDADSAAASLPASSPTESEPLTLTALANEADVVDCDLKDPFKLSKNFMLIPSTQGFLVWSARSQCHFTLALDTTLLLINFNAGQLLSRVIFNNQHLGSNLTLTQATQWLAHQGLIVKIQVKAPPTPPTAAPEPKATTPDPLATATTTVTPWQDLELNGRIPIYFVTHTANHYPLALGMLYSYLLSYNDGELLEHYLPLPIVHMSPQAMMDGPFKKFGNGIWLFSNYMWSLDTNLQMSAHVKKIHAHNITIHGGPSTPNYDRASQDFFDQYPHVDIAVHGEGENAFIDILKALSGDMTQFEQLQNVSGISYRSRAQSVDNVVRTASRTRMKDLDVVSSPYNTGAFDHYGTQVEAAIIESNRGCPFGCTFCDWGSATAQKVRKFDLQRVKDEIEWIGKQQIRVLWIADANYGMYPRDIELSQWICDVKARYGFPREVVVNYTKNATVHLAEIVKIFADQGICSQGIISIQTQDTATLEVINRRNIKTDKYNDLADIFRKENLPLSTDLMIGLPGITVEGFKDDLQYYFDRDVCVKAYPTQMLPNSPMADPEYIEKYKIVVDQNKYLVSSFSYTEAEYKEMRYLYEMFTLFDSYSVLRYVLRYLQWEHDIRAIDFIHTLYKSLPDIRYPALTHAVYYFLQDLEMPGGWRLFYDDVMRFSRQAFNVPDDSALEAVVRFNEYVMPDDGIEYPLTFSVDHDVIGYFTDNNQQQALQNPLASYPPATIEVDDTYSFASINYALAQYDNHQTFWELQSPATRHRSAPTFR